MKRMRGLAFLFASMIASAALAGQTAPRLVPTLGEAGLVALGVSLLGGGLVMLRRRRRP